MSALRKGNRIIMSFIEKLAKGFVRSAVNQVGRDGGRVVSNKLYGDKHAIKIQNVSSGNISLDPEDTTFEDSENDLEGKHFEDRSELVNNGFKVSYSKMGIWSFIFSFIVIFVPFLGPVIFLAIVFLIGTSIAKVNMKTKVNVPVYKSDKRTKTGMRLVGHETKKITVTTRARGLELTINIIELLFYLSMMLGSAYFTYYLFWGS